MPFIVSVLLFLSSLAPLQTLKADESAKQGSSLPVDSVFFFFSVLLSLRGGCCFFSFFCSILRVGCCCFYGTSFVGCILLPSFNKMVFFPKRRKKKSGLQVQRDTPFNLPYFGIICLIVITVVPLTILMEITR